MSLKPCLLSKEMVSFFTDRGYSFFSLDYDLQRVATISHHDALRPSEQSYTNVDRVPLVLNYLAPKSNGSYCRTFVFYQQTSKLDVSFHNHLLQHTSATMLVHLTDHPSIEQPGSGANQRPRSNPFGHISSFAEIRGLESSFTIRDHFTCQSESLVYCISCALLYIGETGRNLRSCFSEHLRSIRAYAQQHSLVSRGPTFQLYWPQYFSDVQVRGVALCNGNPGFTISQGESKIISLNKEYRCKRTHDLTILTAKRLKIS